MKLKITMKDPDCLCEPVEDAVRESLVGMDLSEREAELLAASRTEKLNACLRKWFEYGEYCEIEVDTDAGTATVRKVGK